MLRCCCTRILNSQGRVAPTAILFGLMSPFGADDGSSWDEALSASPIAGFV